MWEDFVLMWGEYLFIWGCFVFMWVEFMFMLGYFLLMWGEFAFMWGCYVFMWGNWILLFENRLFLRFIRFWMLICVVNSKVKIQNSKKVLFFYPRIRAANKHTTFLFPDSHRGKFQRSCKRILVYVLFLSQEKNEKKHAL